MNLRSEVRVGIVVIARRLAATQLAWVFFLLAPRTLGAGTFDGRQARLVGENPPGLSLAISFSKETYHLGERIPVTLRFANRTSADYVVNTRIGRSLFPDITFHLDGPPGDSCDPLATLCGSGVGNGLSGEERIGEYSQGFDLNEWIRFDAPGSYRLYCTSNRVHRERDRSKPVRLCSQIVNVTIIPAGEEFVRRTVRDAVGALESDDHDVRRRAARRLRFLAAPEAVGALVPLFGDRVLSWEAYFGIVGSRDWKHAEKCLWNNLEIPDTVVDSNFIGALAHVSLPREDYPVDWMHRDMEEIRRLGRELSARFSAAERKALKRLAGVLGRKQGRALAVSSWLLVQRDVEASGVRQSLAESFFHLVEAEQAGILGDGWWEKVRCREFRVPLWKIVMSTWKREDWRFPQIHSLALLRYGEFEPKKARALIIEDISRIRPLLSGKALRSLPEESLPELEDVLVSHLLSRRADTKKIAGLIERYATARVLPQVTKFYEKAAGRWASLTDKHLLGYWIKHDRKNGLAAVARAARLRGSGYSRGYTSVLKNVLSNYYGPDAEELAISFLDDVEPDVVIHVVRLLARKGTVACIDPLIAKLQTLDPEDLRTMPRGASMNAVVRSETVWRILQNDRWQLTEKQRESIKKCLTRDELVRYQRILGP